MKKGPGAGWPGLRPFRGGKPVPLKIGDSLEINDKRATVVGIAQAASSFQSQPILYTTYHRATTYALSERKLLSFILVKVKPDERPEAVARRITAETDMLAYTADEFKKVSLNYFVKNTRILFDFGFVVVLGFVIGAAVTGQIFYNFTLDNLRYFGVFKAMGTTNRVILRMILLQGTGGRAGRLRPGGGLDLHLCGVEPRRGGGRPWPSTGSCSWGAARR